MTITVIQEELKHRFEHLDEVKTYSLYTHGDTLDELLENAFITSISYPSCETEVETLENADTYAALEAERLIT